MDIDGDGGRQNSDFVGNAAEQKVIKGTAANSLSGAPAPGLKKIVACLRTGSRNNEAPLSVSTPMLEESDAEALQHYFPERDFVPLMEVLATVNRHTGWMEEFQHWQQRHHHGRPTDRVVYAGVIGIGCTIGIRKMARISHPISESELENAVNWFFSVDNINAASDRVLQLMDRLELPKLLQRTPGHSHTSSDGQKFEVRADPRQQPMLLGFSGCTAQTLLAYWRALLSGN